jgi:hypothetical protein
MALLFVTGISILGNVIGTMDGSKVVDWANVRCGVAHADVCRYFTHYPSWCAPAGNADF